jgi:hypothetical protein
MEYIDLIPKAQSFVESMRDIGYSMETAVADIIDNSITASAKKINIRFDWNNDNPWLAVVDNGIGMSKGELIDAMRLGSTSPLIKRKIDDLGRFGLGLKTASFSQCRCLTVFSKKENVISTCQWDLDYLSHSTDSNDPNDSNWSLRILAKEDLKKNTIFKNLEKEYLDKYESSTIVLWQKLDRVGESTVNSNKESQFNKSLIIVRKHLELVFHRYLSPEIGRKKIYIFFNNNKLSAFDPFNAKKSTELHKEEFYYENEIIKVQPYVLPHHNKVSKVEWKKYEGLQGYLHEQGFYVYRQRRLIIYATWFRLIPKKELTKLLRVRVDIPNSLDHLWNIDIKKSNAFPPTGIREQLKRVIGQIEFSGKRVYKQRGQRLKSEILAPAWDRIAKDNQIHYIINREHPILMQLCENLTQIQQESLENVLSILESSFPRDSFFNDVASKPEQVTTQSLQKEGIIKLLSYFISETDKPTKQKLREILQIDPFASNKELTINIFKEYGYEF